MHVAVKGAHVVRDAVVAAEPRIRAALAGLPCCVTNCIEEAAHNDCQRCLLHCGCGGGE